jgi:hypothetical protein
MCVKKLIPAFFVNKLRCHNKDSTHRIIFAHCWRALNAHACAKSLASQWSSSYWSTRRFSWILECFNSNLAVVTHYFSITIWFLLKSNTSLGTFWK